MISLTESLNNFLFSVWLVFLIFEGCDREYLFANFLLEMAFSSSIEDFSGAPEVKMKKAIKGVRWILNLYYLQIYQIDKRT